MTNKFGPFTAEAQYYSVVQSDVREILVSTQQYTRDVSNRVCLVTNHNSYRAHTHGLKGVFCQFCVYLFTIEAVIWTAEDGWMYKLTIELGSASEAWRCLLSLWNELLPRQTAYQGGRGNNEGETKFCFRKKVPGAGAQWRQPKRNPRSKRGRTVSSASAG
ncbi:LAME_0B00364g1_1 [Lachancea meyersii CBS 8951]|uniref:LAME_0B00364g1_1 n=1 Tax=Lachancea meyersii CBS 8951 TaxID=1266667 RepID=A0A1G4ISC3_9SACH|nr:LAME_0B00364g1_1 [Lachancea meyersii CBS 8951]